MPLVTKGRTTGLPDRLPYTEAEEYAIRCNHAAGPIFWELIHAHEDMKEADWMYDRISEPDLQGHPAYAKAAMRSLDLDAKLIRVFHLMAEQEITANRYWTLLHEDQRKELGPCLNWVANAGQPDLFGQALSLAEYIGIDQTMMQRTTRRVIRSVASFDCYQNWIRKGLLNRRNGWWPKADLSLIRTDLHGPMVRTSGTDVSGAAHAGR